MTIVNGQVADADAVMNTMGKIIKDNAQVVYNTGVAEGNLYNVFYQSTLSADINYGFSLSGGNYSLIDLSAVTYYVIVEAATGPSPGGNIIKISSGKWLIYDSTLDASQEVQRALVHKELWYTGTAASFTGITAFKVSDSTDVGYRGYKDIHNFGISYPTTITYNGTFGTTIDNIVSIWSNLSFTTPYTWNTNVYFEVPSGTVLNTTGGSSATTYTSNEIGTDRQADEKTNPSTSKIKAISVTGGNININTTHIVFTKGTYSMTGATLSIDYFTDNSVPETTLAGTLIAEGAADGTLIFKDTASEIITNTITTWNDSIDATSTLTTSISYDGGTNYEVINDSTIQRNTNTGTALWLKFYITRTDSSKTDSINAWYTKYNLY